MTESAENVEILKEGGGELSKAGDFGIEIRLLRKDPKGRSCVYCCTYARRA
jgi:hypothetical protein